MVSGYNKVKWFVFLSVVICSQMLLAAESGGVVSEFSDGTTSKELVFQNAGTQTVYVKIPKNALVQKANMVIAGSGVPNWEDVGEKESEDYVSLEGDWLNNANCYDGDWNTSAYVTSQSGYRGGIAYFDYTVPENFFGAKVKYKINIYDVGVNYSIKAWDYTALDWISLYSVTSPSQNNDQWYLIDYYKDIPSDCINSYLSGDSIKLRFSTSLYGSTGNQRTLSFYESSLVWAKSELYPNSPIARIGDADSAQVWSYTGDLNVSETISGFSSILNTYLDTAIPDANGDCLIPLTFHTGSAGRLLVDSLRVEYFYSADYINHYDKNNRLVGQEFPSGYSIGYQYDGNGNMTRKIQLGADDNADDVPDILQFINEIPLTEPIDKSIDTDEDGWTDWQELLAGTNFKAKDQVPIQSGKEGEILTFTDENGVQQEGFQLLFKPDRWIMATGDLDGKQGDEVIVGADGDTGERENFVWVLTQSPQGWTSRKLSVGDYAVTSIAMGDPNGAGPSAFIGLRNYVKGGSVIQLFKSGADWQVENLLSCKSADAQVFGVRDGQSVVVCCDMEGDLQNNIYTISSENNWQPEFEKAYPGRTVAGTLLDKQYGFYNNSGSTVCLSDANSIEISSVPDENLLEKDLVAYFPFSGNTYDYSDNQYSPAVTGTIEYVEDRQSQANEALNFDGSSTLSLATTDLSFDASQDEYSVTFWFNPQSNVQGTLVYDTPGSGKDYEGYSYKIYLDASGYLHASQWDSAYTVDLTSDSIMNPDQWYNIAFVVRNQIARLYINGMLVDYSRSCRYNTHTTGGVQIGSSFIGDLDDLKIYNRGLYKSEVQYLYDGSIYTENIPLPSGNKIFFGNPFALSHLGQLEDDMALPEHQKHLVTKVMPLPADPNYASVHSEIQQALNTALDGDIIEIDDGIYYESITIDKQITIQSLNGPEFVVIDGSNANRCVTMNAYAEIIGLTIQHGRLGYNDAKGAGVYMDKGGLLENCIIQDCTMSLSQGGDFILSGAGIYSVKGGVIRECIIQNNQILGSISWDKRKADLRGGGLYINTGRLYKCIIYSNLLRGIQNGCYAQIHTFGGGICSGSKSLLDSCVIRGNSLYANGAMIDIAYGGGAYNCILVNSIIDNNYAESQYTHGIEASNNYVFYNANATGGAYSCGLSNCIVAGNTSLANGHDNCTFSSRGGIEGGYAYNSIFYGNSASGKGVDYDSLSTFYNCLFSNDTYIGSATECIINQSPEFIEYSSGDYHIKNTSPCINSGNNLYVESDTDFDDNIRISDEIVDIGPYEFNSVLYEIPDTITNNGSVLYLSCINDKDNSGNIDPDDEFILASYKLNDEIVSAIQETYVPLEMVYSQAFTLCNIEKNNSLKLFTSEPDGNIYQWNESSNGMTRNLFSSNSDSKQWYALNKLETYYDSDELIGFAADPNIAFFGKLVQWDIVGDVGPDAAQYPNIYQTAPEVEILDSIVIGGAFAKINFSLSDNEYNNATPILQYRLSPTSEWQTATINVANGQSFNNESQLPSQPDGQTNQIIWDAIGDLGAGFMGQVEIRIIAKDISETSQPSNIIQYTVDTTNLDNYPQLAITSAPDTVGYETNTVNLSGSSVNVSGNIYLHNTRNDFSQTIAATSDWHFQEVLLEPGDNEIIITGSNGEGFTASVIKHIWRSRSNGPTVSIDPVNVALSGRYHHFTGVCNAHAVQVLIENLINGDSVTFFTSTSWQSPLLELTLGFNQIRATAFNISGEYTTDEITVNTQNSVWHVDSKNTYSNPDGSPENPFTAIQEAINLALPADEIRVALGEYNENLIISEDIKLLGGFDPNDWNQNRTLTLYKTSLIGQYGSVISIENANAEIEGFVVSGGNSVSAGAGISYIVTGEIARSLELIDCLIENNFISGYLSSNYGAGIYCQGNASVNLEKCIIQNNQISSTTANLIEGAGVYCNTQGPNIFANNHISDNQIMIDSSGQACAAGVYVVNTNLMNNTIVNNSISTISNATMSGAGLTIDSISRIKNTIIWGNIPDQIIGHDCNMVSYSDIQDEICLSSNGNISADPLFVNFESQQYHLQSLGGHWEGVFEPSEAATWMTDFQTSPCIDAGDPNQSYGVESLPHGRRINMGVYGGTGQASRTYLTSTLWEDFDHSQIVDMNDLMLLVDHWLDSENELEIYDINADRIVNFADYSYLSDSWKSVLYKLETNVTGAGTIDPAGGYYSPETIVRLKTVGDLKSWYGTDDDDSLSNSNTVTMTSDKAVSVDTLQGLLMGLVGYWDFDDGTAVDMSSNGNNGFINGAAVAPGVLENALIFDGYGDYVSMPDSDSLNFSSSYITVSAWVNLSDYMNHDARIVGHWSANGSNREYALLVNGNHKFLFILNSLGTGNVIVPDEAISIEAAETVLTNKWYHVLGVWDGSEAKLYVDGSLKNSSAYLAGIHNGTEPLYIGSDGGGTNNVYDFPGIIDEVGLWNRALSESEIKSLYNQGYGLQFEFFGEPPFYEDFDDNLISADDWMSIGNPWNETGGALETTSTSPDIQSYILTNNKYSNFDATFDMNIVTAGGNQDMRSFCFRIKKDEDQNIIGGYELLCRYYDNQEKQLQLHRLGPEGIRLTEIRPYPFVTNIWYKFRIKAEGDNIKIKIWTGDTEPVSWDIDITDDYYSSGSLGFKNYRQSVAQFDNLCVIPIY
jgi:YD repeat-containing protein